MAANRDETIRLVETVSGLPDDIEAREYDKTMPIARPQVQAKSP